MDTGFVQLLVDGAEEYAHMLRFSIKTDEVLDADTVALMALESDSLIDYWALENEYRALLWKAFFVRRFLPSLEPQMTKVVNKVKTRRRELAVS